MKKVILAFAVVLLALATFAKEATLTHEKNTSAREGAMTGWTPFALTLVGPVGLPFGSWDVKGLQIGIWNDVDAFSGLQIGVVNVADRAYGLQIGVVNIIAADDIPFLPILNWSF